MNETRLKLGCWPPVYRSSQRERRAASPRAAALPLRCTPVTLGRLIAVHATLGCKGTARNSHRLAHPSPTSPVSTSHGAAAVPVPPREPSRTGARPVRSSPSARGPVHPTAGVQATEQLPAARADDDRRSAAALSHRQPRAGLAEPSAPAAREDARARSPGGRAARPAWRHGGGARGGPGAVGPAGDDPTGAGPAPGASAGRSGHFRPGKRGATPARRLRD